MKTVLVIVENPELRENIAEILELAGYFVLTNEDSITGLETIKQKDAAMIVYDIRKEPEELRRFMENFHSYAKARKIALTIVNGDPGYAAIKKVTADLDVRFLPSPFTGEELLELVGL
ncbi:MAG TPA: hypothetical protein VL651_06580 [Bacteroidia bacterium]|jgi:DNA-binding NtrC family response regulator|nr:hypothetical protein [Bacteroidia bacterium]